MSRGPNARAVRIGIAALLLFSCSPNQPKADTAPSASSSAPAAAEQVFKRQQPLMGTRFEIQVVSSDEAGAAAAFDAAFAEIARVEALISEWQKTSEMTALNEQAGVSPVPVGPEMLELVRRSVELSARTDGAFDITFAGCGHLWSVSKQKIPTDEEVTACLPRVDYRRIVVDETASTLFLADPGMQAGSGAIGKGFGVDRAAATLDGLGITDYVIDGGGDVRARGDKLGAPWTVGVQHPRRSKMLLGTIQMTDGAVVTSGDYERFFERDGVRYHHIIDPKSGRPAARSIAVTVLAPNATDADALSTGIFVLGPEAGIALAESMDGVEALVVGPDLEQHMTGGFAARFQPVPSDPE